MKFDVILKYLKQQFFENTNFDNYKSNYLINSVRMFILKLFSILIFVSNIL